jgi:hypothetical protein
MNSFVEMAWWATRSINSGRLFLTFPTSGGTPGLDLAGIGFIISVACRKL